MKYSEVNGILIAEVPAKDFKIILYDAKKKSMGKNRCNAGFFGNFHEGKDKFTLPVGHLVCDYAAESKWTEFYCKERGELDGNRFRFDSGSFDYMNPFYGKAQTTLIVHKGMASMEDCHYAPKGVDYAIAGVPIMRNGEDVKFATYVKGQGWGGSSLYATWHIFVGIKSADADTIHVMAMKTKKSNMILAAEAFKAFEPMGFYDVIKLDGGGSFYFNADGVTKSTLENRRVCTIIDFGMTEKSENPYPVPKATMYRIDGQKRMGNFWVQWELNAHGYPCAIDGYFGPGTEKQLKKYQSEHGLVVDGYCGPATRASLLGK